MYHSPLVSVILPNYNHALYLKQRIQSILDQTFQDFELIILDDCSTDSSLQILEQYQGNHKISQIIYNEVNSGSTIKQWKKGMGFAKGELIWIAESDDYADPLFLEKMTSIFKQHEKTFMAYAQSYDVDEAGKIIQSRIKWTQNFSENIWENDFHIPGKSFLKYLYDKNVVPNASACIIRKESLEATLMSVSEIENYKMVGDWFLWLLIADIPDSYIFFKNDHLNFFRDSNQSTRNHYNKEKKINRIIEEAGIFSCGKFEMDKSSIDQKFEILKYKWLDLFIHQKFSFSIFRICDFLPINKFELLKTYFKKKYS